MIWKRAHLLEELSPQHVSMLWSRIKYFVEAACTVHRYAEVVDSALRISLKYGITAYDSSYVALARRLGAKLITLDKELARKLEGTDIRDLLEIPRT